MSTLFKQLATGGINAGMAALSSKGRDQGKVYLVLAVEDRMLKLVDGKNRTLLKPKLKHRNHVKILGQMLSAEETESLINADKDSREKDTFIRKTISLFLNKNQLDGNGGI